LGLLVVFELEGDHDRDEQDDDDPKPSFIHGQDSIASTAGLTVAPVPLTSTATMRRSSASSACSR
jgi:hypothetical protein